MIGVLPVATPCAHLLCMFESAFTQCHALRTSFAQKFSCAIFRQSSHVDVTNDLQMGPPNECPGKPAFAR